MKKKTVIGIILVIAILAICVLLVMMLVRGETKTSGENPANVQGESLVCESTDIAYPFFKYDNSKAKNIKITANFYNNELNVMSLVYTLYYDDAEQIIASEAHNHAAMNISFGENNLGSDAFNAHYSKMENLMKMELYITSGNIDATAARYFMFDSGDHFTVPNTPDEYQQIYRAKGLDCKLNS